MRSIIRRVISEALGNWDPSALPNMFDAIFQKLAIIRNDPTFDSFSGRKGLMFLSFQSLQRAAKSADLIAAAERPGEVESHRIESLTELTKARDSIVEILNSIGGRHRELQDLLSLMSVLMGALDNSEGEYVPQADVGDTSDPL